MWHCLSIVDSVKAKDQKHNCDSLFPDSFNLHSLQFQNHTQLVSLVCENYFVHSLYHNYFGYLTLSKVYLTLKSPN